MDFNVKVVGAVPRFKEFQFAEPINWEIRDGENWVVIGPNGAGKTFLTDILQSRIALKEGEVRVEGNGGKSAYELIKSMAFRDIYSLADCRNMYYQQRWNSADAEGTPDVASLLDGFEPEMVVRYCDFFHLNGSLEKKLISLSSGELRKFLIMRTLLSGPKLLILDNPFIGLDAASRGILNEMLEGLGKLTGLQTILVLSAPGDVPVWADHVLPVKNKRCLAPVSVSDFIKDQLLKEFLFSSDTSGLPVLPSGGPADCDFEMAVKMEKVNVRYGDRFILKGLDWDIRRGDKWALLGGNGSGKSTLLSLVCGDNPQAYANNLTLFDRRRGTGESIWDIKGRIGYLSPDMHTYYLQDIPCIKVVASGFFDSVGLFRKCNEEQLEKAFQWLEMLGASHLAECSFVKISYGEQRLVLLARAMVKNPDLLILDEPLHGLDVGKKGLVKRVIEAFCAQRMKTLIYVTHYREEIPDCVTEYKVLEKCEPV